MSVFKSRVDTGSEAYGANRAEMLALIEELRALEARAVEASMRRQATFEARGQISPRERLAHLLDPGMPFLRLHSLSNYLLEDPNPESSIPGGSVILGIGFVRGVRCMIWVDDSGIRAGAATRGGWLAALNAQEMALRLKLPLLHLVESAGANLMEYQVELWADAGKLFRNLARLSARGIPTMVVLHGPSTAGGAYMPGMSDIRHRCPKNNGRGQAFLAGRTPWSGPPPARSPTSAGARRERRCTRRVSGTRRVPRRRRRADGIRRSAAT